MPNEKGGYKYLGIVNATKDEGKSCQGISQKNKKI